MTPGKSHDPDADRASLASVRRILLMGALGSALYSAAFVAWSGVVVDEVVKPAQVISGAVRYPAGHPDGIYYPGAFSLPNYAAAALWFYFPNAYAMSAVRNAAWVWGSVFTLFAVTGVLTRSALWATLAGVASVCEVAVNFEGIYPMRVWPIPPSHGALGVNFAIVTVVLWVVRSWAGAGFLLGLLPALHASMAPVVWSWALAMALLKKGPDERAGWSRLIWGFGSGVLLSGLVLVLSLRADMRAPVPPYVAFVTRDDFRTEFIAQHDAHRRAFDVVSRGYLLGPLFLVLTGGLTLLGQRPGRRLAHEERRAWITVLSLGAAVWVDVYGNRIVHMALGRLPIFLDILMPYRLSNVSALLVPACLLASIAFVRRSLSPRLRGRSEWLGLLAFSTATVWLVAAAFAGRWNEWERLALHAPFVLLGFVVGMQPLGRENDFSPRWPVVASAAVVALLALVPLWRHSAAIAIMVMLVTWATLHADSHWRVRVPCRERTLHAFAAVGCACLLGAALVRGKSWSTEVNASFLFDDDARILSSWFRANARIDEMVLEPLDPPLEIQAKTGQPVLFDGETLRTMTYLPRLAAVVGGMARDLYGDFTRPAQPDVSLAGGVDPWGPRARAEWNRRSRAEWLHLARRYGFRLVISTKDVPLALPVALSGSAWTLYEIR